MNLFNIFTPAEFTPGTLDSDDSTSMEHLEELYSNGTRYITCSIPKLYYTGYDNTDFNKVTGHYYYSLDDTTCTIYLLSSSMFIDNEAVPVTLTDQTFTARLSRNDPNLKSLLRYMSSDIDWNYYSLSQCTGSIIIDQEDCSKVFVYGILVAMILLGILNILQILNLHKLTTKKHRQD